MATKTTETPDAPEAQPDATHATPAPSAATQTASPRAKARQPNPSHPFSAATAATAAKTAAATAAAVAAPPETLEAPAPAGGVDTPEAAAHDRATYDASRYERPSVTVDVVILTMRERRLEALLVKRRHWPFEGMWAIPGGFVNPDESLEGSARRELAEETNVRDVYLEQLYTFGDPGRDPRTRVITVVYYALIRAEVLTGVPQAGDDAAETAWFPIYNLPTMAFDHENILNYTMDRMRGKLEYTSIGFQLLPPEFTLSELQEVYQAIMNRPLDKRNFRKKVLSTGILEATSHSRADGRHRPAALYRFSPRAGS